MRNIINIVLNYFDDKKSKIFKKNRQRHRWFLPNNSISPIFIAFNIFNTLIILVELMFVPADTSLVWLLFLSLSTLIYCATSWFYDLALEAAILGNFTKKVELNIKYGFWLFLASEFMFFVSFFWAFGHFALSPSIWCGTLWPSEGIINIILCENHPTVFAYSYNFITDSTFINKPYASMDEYNYSVLPLYYKFNFSFSVLDVLDRELDEDYDVCFNYTDYLDYKFKSILMCEFYSTNKKTLNIETVYKYIPSPVNDVLIYNFSIRKNYYSVLNYQRFKFLFEYVYPNLVNDVSTYNFKYYIRNTCDLVLNYQFIKQYFKFSTECVHFIPYTDVLELNYNRNKNYLLNYFKITDYLKMSALNKNISAWKAMSDQEECLVSYLEMANSILYYHEVMEKRTLPEFTELKTNLLEEEAAVLNLENNPEFIDCQGFIVLHYNVWTAGGTNNPFFVPFINTVLLVLSGVTVNAAHTAFVKKNVFRSYVMLTVTILLSFLFLFLQYTEYANSNISINDGAYGSVFYLTTGFHGLHVIIGTIMLIILYFKIYFNHFSLSSQIYFRCAVWYWHFVDAVWVALFLIFYWWGTRLYHAPEFIEIPWDHREILSLNIHADKLNWYLQLAYDVHFLSKDNKDINFIHYNTNMLKRDPRHLELMWILLEPHYFTYLRENRNFNESGSFYNICHFWPKYIINFLIDLISFLLNLILGLIINLLIYLYFIIISYSFIYFFSLYLFIIFLFSFIGLYFFFSEKEIAEFVCYIKNNIDKQFNISYSLYKYYIYDSIKNDIEELNIFLFNLNNSFNKLLFGSNWNQNK